MFKLISREYKKEVSLDSKCGFNLPNKTISRKGFTLIELLVSCAVLIVVLTGIFMVLNQGTKGWHQEMTLVGLQQQLRRTIRSMSIELRQAENIPNKEEAGDIEWEDRDEDITYYVKNIKFNIGNSGLGETVTTIKYFLDDNKIIRKYYDVTDVEKGEVVLLNNVDSLSFTLSGDVLDMEIRVLKKDTSGREIEFILTEKIKLRNV